LSWQCAHRSEHQGEASDQWAYYQAKGVKAAVQDAIAASWRAAGKEPPAEAAEKVRRYGEEQEAIREKAVEKERERDALFQVSIALGAVAALTRIRLVWAASLVVGLGGLVSAARVLLG
jgi:hypothetical protein